MSQLDAFLSRVKVLSVRASLSEQTLSTKLLGSGARISDIRSGKDIGVRRLARAAEALAELEMQYGVASEIMPTSSHSDPADNTQIEPEKMDSRAPEPMTGRAG